MNAVEIEEAISKLAEQPFDPSMFPYAFLEAFGNKSTTIKRLQSGASNKSDIEGGVLQYNNIHIAVCDAGEVHNTLQKLKQSPATSKQKAKFILATDGVTIEAEDVTSDEPPIVCAYADIHNHFGFFLALAGITTVKQIRESSFDIKATGRLNRLYMELLKDNPEWGKAERRHDMNHFMARLIFCFFAEDTDIFRSTGLFTATIDQMSAKDSTNTSEVISELFRAMNTKPQERAKANIRSWADIFPYVNGGLFSGSTEVPVFSKIARSYLLKIGELDWKAINPDIFGSMIQAVAEDAERGALGMHYTSVPNILKVLNPLFLDELREQLEAAGNSPQKLLNLRRRMAKIRVFDPACGSGNFLVIAYKEMRAIEAEINKRRDEPDLRSEIPLTNFRGIELRDFPAEIARLALIIAEYQCDVLYRGQKEALAEFLPLNDKNWITCGNALRLDWLSLMGVHSGANTKNVKIFADDLFGAPLDQAQIDFENEGGETYICGNPPYLGSQWQSEEQKSDLKAIFDNRTKNWKSLDYVAGWFMKAADYIAHTQAEAAFVSTNSICQGRQVATLWSLILQNKCFISFAHTSFKWANLASNNAGVTVAIVGIANCLTKPKQLFALSEDGKSVTVKQAENINPYLAAAENVLVEALSEPLSTQLSIMSFGNMPNDGGHLLLNKYQADDAIHNHAVAAQFIRPFIGSQEFIRGQQRYCLWIEDEQLEEAMAIAAIKEKIDLVHKTRVLSKNPQTVEAAKTPHKFFQNQGYAKEKTIIVPSVSSERREYLPVGLLGSQSIVSNLAFALYDAPLWNMALIASRLHLVWVATVCGKLKTDFRYSNTLGWNTFPIPPLTEKNRADLTRCAEDILLAREAHFPATIADLYDPDNMPENLRHAHDRNDEVLERIYIGRRFKNDTERLEKLFDLYTKMTSKKGNINV